MPNLKKIQLLFAILILLTSTSVCAQAKSQGKNIKRSNLIIKDTTVTKNDVQTDSSAIKTKLFFTRKSYDTTLLKDFPEYLNSLSRINFVSGKIFFTGNGFSETVVATFYGNFTKNKTFTNYFSRCVSGSRIVLEDCTFKNKEGILIHPFTRSVYIR